MNFEYDKRKSDSNLLVLISMISRNFGKGGMLQRALSSLQEKTRISGWQD